MGLREIQLSKHISFKNYDHLNISGYHKSEYALTQSDFLLRGYKIREENVDLAEV